MQKRSILSYLGFAALTAGAAAIGAIATKQSVDSAWYRLELRKPPYQPPGAVFGPVWTALYAMIAASGARVYQAPRSPERTRALMLWGTQLALNATWSAIFFGARRPQAAVGEIVVLLASIGAYAHQARKVDPLAARLVLPYFAWTTFATVLNADIAWRNR